MYYSDFSIYLPGVDGKPLIDLLVALAVGGLLSHRTLLLSSLLLLPLPDCVSASGLGDSQVGRDLPTSLSVADHASVPALLLATDLTRDTMCCS